MVHPNCGPFFGSTKPQMGKWSSVNYFRNLKNFSYNFTEKFFIRSALSYRLKSKKVLKTEFIFFTFNMSFQKFFVCDFFIRCNIIDLLKKICINPYPLKGIIVDRCHHTYTFALMKMFSGSSTWWKYPFLMWKTIFIGCKGSMNKKSASRNNVRKTPSLCNIGPELYISVAFNHWALVPFHAPQSPLGFLHPTLSLS